MLDIKNETKPRISPLTRRLRREFWRYFYPYLTTIVKDLPVVFLNYGYVDLDGNTKNVVLQEIDEPNRIFIQLYNHVVSTVELNGRDILEVSCGHGGGASYIMRYKKPKSMLGLDLNVKAIDFCNHHHPIEGLSFVQGDAEALQFEENTFDGIVNVEASHCYIEMERFLSEVVRVLRPGGHFLFADIRRKVDTHILHEQLVQSGLKILKREIITPNILEALKLSNEVKLELIRQYAPGMLHLFVKEFAAIKGSRLFKAFNAGESVYLSYTLQKLN